MFESLEKLQNAFGGGPLAAMLGLAVLAIIALAVLYVREAKAHHATTREVLTLTTTIAKTWETHLVTMEGLREDMHTTIMIFRVLEPRLTPVPRERNRDDDGG